MFIDEARIYLQGGQGGNGAISFLREKYVPNGGPAGGDGGDGGDVIFEVDSGLSTLMDFRHQRHYRAPSGENGGNNNSYGRGGQDIVIRVPPGTLVYNDEEGTLMADLVEPGQRQVMAKGGRGGRGNSHFVNSVHRSPRVAEKGQPGQSWWVRLELNLLADVGLVGFPNAGKSTLISRISSSRPRIADYPFTTLVPNLGVVGGYGEAFVVADVPGLIEGAHAGLGLGHAFLRHLKRTRVLVHLVDMDPMTTRDPLNDYRIIEHELSAFSPDLAARPRLVVATKADLDGSAERIRALQAAVAPVVVYPLSSVTGYGRDDLMWELRKVLDRTPKPKTAPEPESTLRPTVHGFDLVQEDAAVRVVGDVEERAAMTYWGNPEAEEYFAEYLRRRGVPQLLRKRNIATDTAVLVGEGRLVWKQGDLIVESLE
ncbi:MAG: GTPase ObgE [Firmicutes bacterium]|jgi:GTP-binding protein|nr:GTPase ObgE [Bacillota bacterium]